MPDDLGSILPFSPPSAEYTQRCPSSKDINRLWQKGLSAGLDVQALNTDNAVIFVVKPEIIQTATLCSKGTAPDKILPASFTPAALTTPNGLTLVNGQTRVEVVRQYLCKDLLKAYSLVQEKSLDGKPELEKLLREKGDWCALLYNRGGTFALLCQFLC